MSLVWASAALTACSGDGRVPPAPPAPHTTEAPAASDEASPDARGLHAAADARTATPALRAALLASDPAIRAHATLAVSRLHDAAHAAELRNALRDPTSAVRRAASMGLGALESDAPAGTEAVLLGALATERDGATRAALLGDLGRIATDTTEPAFRDALEAQEPAERDAACRGLGAVGLRGRSVDAALLRLVATRAAEDAAPEVRLACTYALSRLPPPASSAETTAAVVAELVRTARDGDAEVRLMAARALGKYPTAPVEAVAALTADSDWRVAVQAFRTLARRSSAGSDGPYASALRALLDRLLRAPSAAQPPATAPTAPPGAPRLSLPSAHVLLVALEEASGAAAGVNVAPVAQDALRRLALPEASATRVEGLAHCLAAKLVDLARGWPQRLTRCGLGKVSETERAVRMTEVLQAASGDPAGRAGYLLRLYERGDVRVREAVLAATAKVDDPVATRLVLRGLRESDLGVVTSALEAVAAQPARLLAISDAPATTPAPGAAPATPPAPSAAPSLVPPPDGGATPSARLSTGVRAALDAARETLAATDELEGLQAWLEAAGTLRDPALAPGVRGLAVHANVTLRAKANATLEALGLPRDDAPPAAIGNALEARALPRADERLSAVLTLASGDVEVALLPAEAPTTVARFVALAERGFYDGLRFHRVVAAFVVQGGDPRGDGYGGPGYAQRCEDNRVRYERGTVGMALAGRDTGGSQFFVTQAAQPHLDGRYTAFGRVVRGMELVDQLLPDDVLTRVRIVRATGIAEDTTR